MANKIAVVFVLMFLIGATYMVINAFWNVHLANIEVEKAEKEMIQSQQEVDEALEDVHTSMNQLCRQSTEC